MTVLYKCHLPTPFLTVKINRMNTKTKMINPRAKLDTFRTRYQDE